MTGGNLINIEVALARENCLFHEDHRAREAGTQLLLHLSISPPMQWPTTFFQTLRAAPPIPAIWLIINLSCTDTWRTVYGHVYIINVIANRLFLHHHTIHRNKATGGDVVRRKGLHLPVQCRKEVAKRRGSRQAFVGVHLMREEFSSAPSSTLLLHTICVGRNTFGVFGYVAY